MSADTTTLRRAAWVPVPLAAAIFLVVSSIGKFADIETFSQAIADHGIVPQELRSPTVWGVPVLELSAGLGALWALMNGGRLASAVRPLLIVYGALFVYTLVLWVSPPENPSSCGCGLSSEPVQSWEPLALRNGVFASALLASALFAHRKPRQDEPPGVMGRAARAHYGPARPGEI